MSVLMILAAIAVLAIAAFVLSRQRALASAGGNPRLLHSLPVYYGWFGALGVLVPSLAALAIWLIVQPMVIENRISAALPEDLVADATQRELTMADVRRVAGGLDTAVAQGAMTDAEAGMIRTELTNVRDRLAAVGVALGSDVSAEVLSAAQDYRELAHWGAAGRTVVVILLAVIGLFWAVARVNRDFRARNLVERVILGLLMAASSIAILTTIGIVWSMVSETFDFFSKYPIQDFFFSLTWSPNFRGGSELGIIPLIWGTLYITLVSMLVAVPIGLFTAIYLAEYASRRVRNWVKPLIVGDDRRHRDRHPEHPLHLVAVGRHHQRRAAKPARRQPRPWCHPVRDGAPGRPARRAARDRRRGADGRLARHRRDDDRGPRRRCGRQAVAEPVRVKIVGQLTGDTDFAAPETLVAFALGMTLFVITLGLNIFALWIVRKYREQYE